MRGWSGDLYVPHQGVVQGPTLSLLGPVLPGVEMGEGKVGERIQMGAPGCYESGLHFLLLFALFQEGWGSEFLFLL